MTPHSRVVQLALENENQHVFEYIKVEMGSAEMPRGRAQRG